MQNFTLGKKGISMLLFGLVLLTTSFSSFGQENCPTVSDQAQEFCYLATVNDLLATPTNNDPVRWYRSASSPNPIPNNELLASGNYFAGNQSGSCTNRIAVDVTVTTLPAPTKTTAGATFDPCQFSPNDTHTVSEIIAQFEPGSGYAIQVFDTEYGTTALGAGVDLIDQASYYVGKRDDPSTSSSCPSLRVAIRYSPILALAPTGEAIQIFCEGASVADLVASGTNRWYSTETSQPALAGSTPLITGTYYASQIVNRSNSNNPPCESVERFEVTVTVNNVLIEETQRFCASIGEGNNFRKPQVQDLSPDGTWYDDNTFTTPLAFDDELTDGNVYYSRIPDNCETRVVTAEFFDTPNAGSTTSLNACENIDPFNLVDEINNSQLGPAQQTGRFSPELSTGTLFFDPSDYAPGTYNFRYIVDGNSDCPTDESRITVIVDEAPIAGSDISETVCSLETQNLQALITKFSSLLVGRDQNGTFSNNSLDDLAIQYSQNPIGTFTTTYTVTNEAGCTDSASISLEILQSPYAGEDAIVILADEGNGPIDLFSRLGGTPDFGGTWSPGNGTFDPVSDTPGIFNYTVMSNGCEDSAKVTVTEACPVVQETTQEFCASIGTGNNFRKPQVRDLMPAGVTWYATADSDTPLTDTTVLVDDENYFAGNVSGTCPDRTEVTVVVLLTTPNAGSTSNITVCSNAEPFDLIDRINPSILGAPDRDGTFSPALASGSSIFDPTVDIARQYIYTVVGGSCPKDESRITVKINQAPNAGIDINEELCINPNDDLLPTAQEFMAIYADDSRDSGGTFIPSLNSLLEDFQADPFGTFTTLYSVTANGCTDTANLSVTINEEVPANAGDDVELTFCSTDGIQNLFESLGEGVNPNGIFEGLENGMFDPSTSTIGETIITYKVSEDESCVIGTDTADFIINVNQGPDPGENGIIEVSRTDVPFNLFTKLEGSPMDGGIWSPGNTDGSFNPATGDGGLYTYTITNGECEASANVTVVILDEEGCPIVDQPTQIFCESISGINGNNPRRPRVSDLLPAEASWYVSTDSETALPSNTILVSETTYYAGNTTGTCDLRTPVLVTIDNSPNAGSTTFISVCADAAPFDLLDVFNESILGVPDAGGVVSPPLASGTTLFNPAVDPGRQYRYTVQSENEICPDDFAFITIKVSLNEDANAGDPFTLEFCTSNVDVNLFDELADDVTLDGTFEGDFVTNGVFSPSTSGEGSFPITYKIGENLPCVAGADSAIITIKVNGVPNAPVADAEQTFCTSANPTVADLVASGDNISWYEDADLTIPANNTDSLMFDKDYYAVSSSDSSCVSSFTKVTVLAGDSPDAPVADANQSFCLVDNNTVADLMASGDNIVWYEDAALTMVALATTPLENADVYYAVTSGDNTCDSASTMVTVTMTDPDSPTLQMDGNEFCRRDNPTLQELLDNINGSGIQIYSSLTGGTAIASSTALEDGVEYFATSTNSSSDCESSERLAIRVEVSFCGIPEGFSPNGDNINDQFVIPDIAINYPNYNIEIYNRWGNMVFKGNASTPDWDGISNQSGTIGNGVLPVGVYFYILNYNDGATTSEQGKLYLSR